MENCLITQLDAVVNDPNLPVLETMQQFTLDAITASGNSVMTNAQKAALNHFFYQIGAIGSNTLWSKIKILLLPMICNENLEKALVNYKGNILEGSLDSQYWSFSEDGGLACSTTDAHITLTTHFVGSSAKLSIACATMGAYMPVSNGGWKLGNASAILNGYFTSHSSANDDYIGNGRGVAIYVRNLNYNFDVGGVRFLEDSIVVKFVNPNGDEISAINTDLSGAREEVIYDSTTGRVQLTASTGNNHGAIMLADEMTEAEMSVVLNALSELKRAF